MPTPTGGFEAITLNLNCPEIARQACIQGWMGIRALISEQGEVVETQILESLGENGCDQAAVLAIKSVKWQPAREAGQPVPAWVTIPVHFRL